MAEKRIVAYASEAEHRPNLDQTFAYDLAGDMTPNSRLGAYTYPVATAQRPHAQLTAGARTYA